MSNPALLHLPLRGTLDGRDRNGVVSATVVGPVRFSADGYYAEEGTTNEVLNPMQTSATGRLLPVGATIAQISDDGMTGTTSLEVTTTANSNGVRTSANPTTPPISMVAPQTNPLSPRTFSFAVRAVSGEASWQVYVAEFDATHAVLVSSVIATPTFTTDWQRYDFTYTPTQPTVSYTTFGIRSPNGNLRTMRVTDLQIEQNAYATSFCHGSIGTGYSWAGTAHNSASTRAASSLSFDELNRVNSVIGAVAFRFRRTVDTGGVWYLFYVGGSSGKDVLASRIAADDKPTIATGEAGVSALARATWGAANTVNQSYVYYADWDSTTARLSIDNGALVSGARGGTPLGELVADFYLGSTSAFTAYSNSYLSDLLIFDRPLTDAERATLAATPEWSFGVLQPKVGGILRIGMQLGMAIGSVAAPAAIGIAREFGGLS